VVHLGAGDGGLKRKLLTGLVLFFIVGLLVIFARPDYRQGESSLTGRPAKDFTFSLNGKEEHLSDWRGKVVLLNFWATWCPPCVDELASLNRLQHQIASRGGVVFGISIDDDETAYEQFLKQHAIDYLNYRDASKKIAEGYGTSMYPETYIVDRKGKIDRKVVGGQNWTSPELIAYLDNLLAKK